MRESLKALAAFPEMPVAELRVELAGGSWARKHSLVFHVDLVKSRFHGPGLVQEREVPGAGSLREDHRARLGGGGQLAALAERLQDVLSAHGLHDRRGHVYWENSKRVTRSVLPALKINTVTHTLKKKKKSYRSRF